jgi:FlaG/FlaF family flagellin (archaellin)
MEKTKLVLIIALSAFVTGHSQSFFTGRVLDENKIPLPESTIIIKDGTNGVGELISINGMDYTFKKQKVDINLLTSWTKELLVFNRKNLSEVVIML